MKVLIDIPQEMYKATQTYYSDNTTRLSIKSCIEKIANGTPIPDNATNGDMIKAMFNPCMIFTYTSDVQVYFSERYYQFFGMSWWNAPYKGVEE